MRVLAIASIAIALIAAVMLVGQPIFWATEAKGEQVQRHWLPQFRAWLWPHRYRAAPPIVAPNAKPDEMRRPIRKAVAKSPIRKAIAKSKYKKAARPRPTRLAARPKVGAKQVRPKLRADGGPDLPWSCAQVRWGAFFYNTPAKQAAAMRQYGIPPLTQKQLRQARACLAGRA